MKKCLAFLLCIAMLLSVAGLPVFAADDEITVLFNGKPLEFDVPPMIDPQSNRTLVPMRAIFEALGAEVNWEQESRTATGVRNGIAVAVTIGESTATVANKPVEIDQPPIIHNDRTLVPLRFISEAYNSVVDWDGDTRTITITADPVPEMFYYIATSFEDLGTWKLSDGYLQGLATGSTVDTASADGAQPASTKFNVKHPGKFRLWIRARDYATNQPGTRTFHAAIDGKLTDTRFGAHGQEGFVWTDGGVYDLTEGIHTLELVDTSGFYARCSGALISGDLDFVPPANEEELNKTVMAYDPLATLTVPQFPSWAKKAMTDEKTASIENDAVKVTFFQGQGEKGSLVQNEIDIKVDGQWVPVKQRNEELGYLMMSAEESNYAGLSGVISSNVQTLTIGDKTYSQTTDNYYRSGYSDWFIPSDFEQVDEKTVVLTFPANERADLKVTFALDSLAVDPKVTLDASFKKKGAFSFLLYSGDAVKYDDFERVTSPLLYVKKVLPETLGGVTPDCFMFTPMATFTFAKGNKYVSGKEFTSGIVMDPSYVTVDVNYNYPDTAKFGVTFQAPNGDYRNNFVAPAFGSTHCKFDEGETTSISYRIINRADDWFTTYKHIAEEIYNLGDVRTNYFHSLNEAIYNTTDLMMDDDFGGWDNNAMSFYNMESRQLTTTSNALAIIQRYLLTEDEDYLERRAIPTLAYSLARSGYHFKPVVAKGGSDGYVGNPPSKMGSPVSQFDASDFGGLYEMTQGRVPALMNQAVSKVAATENLAGINSMYAMYKYTGDKMYLDKVKELADEYLKNDPTQDLDIQLNSGFVFGDYTVSTTALLNAYEMTGDQKYLEGAKKAGEVLMTGLWTTGYQNDNLTATTTIDPDATMARRLNCENFNFWWHGDQVWRLGNVDGEAKKPQDLPLKIAADTVPNWLFSKAGLGTEHTRTPGHGNIITMNNWAGTVERLYAYTGEEMFNTQARNAMLGRFGNYPGYYQDRNIVHQMKADYPYVGPDYTSIYWHHVPVFLSMLEDYLINSVWVKSNKNIEFPGIYQQGYAYFASSQYGQAPGKFYDQDGMWLWLDRGIIEPDSVNIDYITARKDGVLGLALINEDNKELTTTVSLGEKVPGGASFTGTATVYDANGGKSSVEVANGQFTITIPSKDIRSLVLAIPGVKTPGFAKAFTYSNELGETVSEHTRGKGYVLQLNDNNYFAYVYVTDMAADTSKVTINYQIDGKSYTEEQTDYPYEFIVKVDDPTKAFTYKLTATSAVNGSEESLGGGTLKPLSMTNTPAKLTVPQTTKDAAQVVGESPYMNLGAFKVEGDFMGQGGGNIRIVTKGSSYPVKVKANELKGLRVYASIRGKTDGSVRILDSKLNGNEVRDNGDIVLLCKPTKEVPIQVFDDYLADVALEGTPGAVDIKTLVDMSPLEPPSTKPSANVPKFEPFKLTLKGQGTSGKNFRFVVSTAGFPFEVTEADCLKNLILHVKLTSIADGSVMEYEGPITSNEIRSGATVIVIPGTSAVPAKDYNNDKAKTHDIELELKYE